MGWEWGKREVQDEKNIRVHKADSLCSTEETNTTMENNYTPDFFLNYLLLSD